MRRLKASTAMRRRRGSVSFLLCGIVGGVVALGVPATPAEAQLAANVEAHLAFGEFAPAVRLAEGVEDRTQRDALLERIGAAQAAAGARDAAIQTASMIHGDLARSRVLAAPRPPVGAFGGAVFADFEPLMDIIRTTVSPDSWDDLGGLGAMREFPGGVYVDTDGVMRRVEEERGLTQLASLRREAAMDRLGNDVRRSAGLRKVSLPRLEKQVQLRIAAGQPLDEAMRCLAGLRRVEYVLVYPETGDLVLAGPAGDWTVDAEGRTVSVETNEAVLQLDDLVVMLRNAAEAGGPRFTCSIVPRAEGLARAQEFSAQQAGRPLKPGERKRWLEQLRSELGPQDLEVLGLDPRSRAARVMLEADYRMKLVGIGLEDGVLDVPSYFDIVAANTAGAPPALSVVRWWFTLDYDPIAATPQRDAFAVTGRGAQLLSENELLDELGQRVHTGEADHLNREFSQRFTRNFEALARKHPVYGDLRAIFDLAVAAALIETESLDERVDWHQTCFGDPEQFRTMQGPAPQQVDSVMNHRVIRRKHILAAVSGGVRCDTTELVQPDAIADENTGRLASERDRGEAAAADDRWWWD